MSEYMYCRISKNVYYFDPAIKQKIPGCLLSEEDIGEIRKTLAAVNIKYGKDGLKCVRELNLTEAIWNHHIEVFDSNNLYDLPVDKLAIDENIKMIVLDTKEYSLIKRTLDALSCHVLISYPNENVKSALFSMPYLLYDEEEKFLDQTSILELLQEISSRMKLPILFKFEEESFSQAIEICKQIYLEKNLEQYQYKNNNPSKRLQRIKKVSKDTYQES